MDCWRCAGSGQIDCPACGSDHRMRCPWCAGSGKYPKTRAESMAERERGIDIPHPTFKRTLARVYSTVYLNN